jgi:hypothetical protein
LLSELEPCEDEVTYAEAAEISATTDQPMNQRDPCWKMYELGPPEPYTGYQDPIPVKYCGACQRNADLGRVVALRHARKRRGGLTSALVRAVDHLIAESEEKHNA